MCNTCETPAVQAGTAPSTGDLDFVVEGMTCGGCASKVTAAVQGVSGVDDVRVDLGEGRLSVTGSADASAITAAVESAGYAVTRA
ncbi:heavy-metal-associated domain-containing protein [Saccharothrix sp. S26]|uniref:heavy-metal-associated domain-containing protein n=1 Tax=Saccharothrix sp. S26 TaxID=2907215 RepID=UPI001F2AEEA1|nr:heavy metal-associated domain-containing protein [Saccharothrix sp. S26]MCE6999027.1 heavy-metal-associated domain-containing protein [Saccharothrix sp. S26]